jgi:glycosyltransferase involved in cell wall biosynthesis
MGGALESCQSLAARQQPARTVFCGPFEARETLSILAAADVLALPTRGDQSLVSMPSKLISYMLAARPVLAIARAESDLAGAVRDSGCGWVVEPGDVEQLVNCIRTAAAMDRPALNRMGALGRAYALAHFSTEACLPRMVALLESTMRAARPKSTTSALKLA